MTERRPEVSVLMAVRNAEHLVEEQIVCVLSQRGVRLELLICDDASTDGTWAKLAAWRHDPRVRLLRNRRRLFPAATRNRLLALARGPYCSPCDADDLLLPGALSALVKALRANPGAGAASGLLVQTFADRRRPPRLIGVTPVTQWDLMTGRICHAASLIRTGLLKAVGGYAPHLRLSEDWDLMLRLRERATFVGVPGLLAMVWRLQQRSRSRIVRGRTRAAREIVRAAVARGRGSQRPLSRER
ncbi:MAG: glycosyltransferase family 2 protein [Vicinamibacteria bacterium]|nr:glycosyltransferase family 2 protein [Vicinamibacteria bacterium]